MEYKVIDIENSPEEVKNWVEENKLQEAHTVIHTETNTYVVITRGQKRTGGYGIEVISVEEMEDKITILVKYIEKDRDGFVIQLITYPYIIIELPKTDKKIKILFEHLLDNE